MLRQRLSGRLLSEAGGSGRIGAGLSTGDGSLINSRDEARQIEAGPGPPMSDRAARLSRPAAARYLVALGAVIAAFALRVLLTPLTGTGAPFVLFFAAVLVTSLYVGTGPGLVALGTSLPIAAYMFVVRAGYPVDEAVFQALLYV